MEIDQIREVVHEVWPGTPLQEINGWMSMRCPLARYTHEKGSDKTASAGVSIHPDGTSIYNCFTCGVKKPFHEAIRDYAEFTGEDLDDLIEELEEGEFLGPRELPDWDRRRQDNIAELLVPLDEATTLDLYDTAAGHPYLKKRGISQKTVELLDLRFDPCDPIDGSPRILFPIRGADGLLYGFSGRDVSGKARLKVRDYPGLQKAHNILGANLIARDKPDKIIVVEGLFDVASVYEQGYYAAGVMHSTLTKFQAEILNDFEGAKYLFYDDDKAGDKGAATAGPLLREYAPTFDIAYPEIWIEDPDEEGGGHLVKDPGELLADEIQEMIDHAVMLA
jgi:hypothetical protein